MVEKNVQVYQYIMNLYRLIVTFKFEGKGLWFQQGDDAQNQS